ncbi:MAG TPA: GDSL-type esterase/lipase family protein, partial [Verrucomicrobiaceae bacterium]
MKTPRIAINPILSATRLLLLGAILCPPMLRADKATVHPRPDPARFAKEIAAFDDAWKKDPAPTGGIVFTGSSSVRLWDVKKAFPDLPVLNRGFGGSVANDLNVYAGQVVLRYKPKVLVVYTGSNDLHAKLEPEEAFADYEKFLLLVHEKLPDTRVIVSSVKFAPSRVTEMDAVKKLNGMLESWCREKTWVRWVEATSFVIGADGQPIESLYRSDRLHLNDDGYAKWNAIIGPV